VFEDSRLASVLSLTDVARVLEAGGVPAGAAPALGAGPARERPPAR
jgi:hypothetical protein